MKLTKNQLQYIILMLEGCGSGKAQRESDITSYEACMLVYELKEQLDNVQEILDIRSAEVRNEEIKKNLDSKKVKEAQVNYMFAHGNQLTSYSITKKDGKVIRKKGQVK